jgi:flavodoxin
MSDRRVVVYYSLTGRSKKLAERLADTLHSEDF